MHTINHDLLRLYALMLLTRALDEQVQELRYAGKISGFASARGYEAVSVGAAFALQAADVVAPVQHDLGAYLVRGVTARTLMAQWLGRSASPTRGHDNHLHFGDMRERLIVPLGGAYGATLPVAVGTALATYQRNEQRVTLAFCGDGVTSTGNFHEALEFAATLDLPFICVIENAGATASGRDSMQFRSKHVSDRAAGYGLQGYIVDGMDVVEVVTTTQHVVEAARSGRGPAIIEARLQLEIDPIARLEQRLVAMGMLDDSRRSVMQQEVTDILQDALAYAVDLPEPEATPFAIFAPDDALGLGPALNPAVLALVRAETER